MAPDMAPDTAPDMDGSELGVRFSHRLRWSAAENSLARHEADGRARTPPALFYDLTNANPTLADLPFDDEQLRAVWAATASTVGQYRPSPRGSPRARAALAADLRGRGLPVEEERILLTSSSSESYAHLFKLFADPGDAVLIPTPSYPLFDYLAALEGVAPLSYRFWHTGDGWALDEASLDEAFRRASAQGRRVAALVAVSPNNPTGHWLTTPERQLLELRAERHRIPLIVDEVFQDFALDGRARSPAERCAATDARVLTFSLGGLSKALGLPQIKVGWMVVGGPAKDVEAALAALETIADTYLSIAAPSEAGLPALLSLGAARRAHLQARLLAHRATARETFAGTALSPLSVEGGWSLLLRVPSLEEKGLGTDEDWVREALLRKQTLIQPGFFFDLTGGPFLVASLLATPRAWSSGLAALREVAE